MTKTEWIARARARYILRGESDPVWAQRHAENLARDFEHQYGQSAIAWGSPVEAVDEELAEGDEE